MKLKTRLTVELVIAGLAAGVFVATLLAPSWIEMLFGVDPDRGNGDLERMIVVIAAAVAVAASVVARWDWRRSRRAGEGVRHA